jgi:hypothetical protein
MLFGIVSPGSHTTLTLTTQPHSESFANAINAIVKHLWEPESNSSRAATPKTPLSATFDEEDAGHVHERASLVLGPTRLTGSSMELLAHHTAGNTAVAPTTVRTVCVFRGDG